MQPHCYFKEENCMNDSKVDVDILIVNDITITFHLIAGTDVIH